MNAALAGTRDAVLVVGGDAMPLLTNAAFTELLGEPRALQQLRDAAGRHLPTEEWPQHRAARGEAFELEFMLDHPDLQGRSFEAQGGPIRDPAGRAVGGLLVIRDITERRRADRELRAHAAAFRSAFADAAVGLAIVDRAGRFLHVNRAYCALVGYDEAALLATDCLAITDAADRERHQACLDQPHSGAPTSVTLEVRYRTGSGRAVAAVTQVALMRGVTGQETMIALAQEHHPLALRRAQEEFSATVSHDLRTPLTVIQAGLGLLANSAAERLLPSERGLLDNLARNTARLTQLINDLLSLNQLRVAALQSEVLPFDLRRALHAAFAPLYPLLAKRRQDLALALDAPLPVEGDARQLEQAFLNVLYAVHAAAPQSARLVVRGWDTAADIHLAISATGTQGFAANDEGLGLTVARGIIDLHGGQLLAGPPAVGPPSRLTYTITLPRSRTPLVTREATTTMMEDGDGTEVADRGR